MKVVGIILLVNVDDVVKMKIELLFVILKRKKDDIGI